MTPSPSRPLSLAGAGVAGAAPAASITMPVSPVGVFGPCPGGGTAVSANSALQAACNPIELGAHRVELLLQRLVALDRVAADLLIDVRRHAGQVGDVRLQAGLVVAHALRGVDELFVDRRAASPRGRRRRRSYQPSPCARGATSWPTAGDSSRIRTL